MATIPEKSPGVWEVRVFTGRDDRLVITRTRARTPTLVFDPL